MLSDMFPGAPRYPAAEEQLSQEDPSMKITGMKGSGNLNHMFPPSTGEGWKVSLGVSDTPSNNIPTDVFNKNDSRNKAEAMLGLSSGNKKSKNNINDYFGGNKGRASNMLSGGSGNTKVSDMLSFNTTKKGAKIVDMILGTKTKNGKIDSMLGTTKKGKQFNMDKFFSTGKNNNQFNMDKFFSTGKDNNPISKVLGGFAIKPMSPLGAEKNARKYMIRNPVGLGMTRVKQQKNLSPFGDFDGDKLVNVLDCQPLNAKKQGWLHSAFQAVKGADYNPETEDEELPEAGEITPAPFEYSDTDYNPETEDDIIPELGGPGVGAQTWEEIKEQTPIEVSVTKSGPNEPNVKITTPESETSFMWGGYQKPTPENAPPLIYPPSKPVGPQPAPKPTIGEKVWGLASQAIAERGKTQREKAKFEAEVEKATYTQKVAHEAKMRKGQFGGYPKSIRQTGKILANAPTAFGGSFGGFGDAISPQGGIERMSSLGQQQGAERMAMMLGMSGSGGGAYQAVSSSNVPYSVKVDELVGSGQLAQQWQERERQQPQPVPQPQPQQQQQQRYAQEQGPAPQGPPQQSSRANSPRVWSPFSRRYVTYTRGPYKM